MSDKVTVQLSQETYDSLKSQIEEKENKTKEKKKVNIQIKNRFTGSVVYESEKTTYKEAVVEAVLRSASLRSANLRDADLGEANLRNADLRNANLGEANLDSAKFYGKTSTPKVLNKAQVPVFLDALGFKVE